MRPLALLLVVAVALPMALAGRDYYEVLGIEKQANDKEIKRVRVCAHGRCTEPPPCPAGEMGMSSPWFRKGGRGEGGGRGAGRAVFDIALRALSVVLRRTESLRRRCTPTKTRTTRKPTKSLRRSATVRALDSSDLRTAGPARMRHP